MIRTCSRSRRSLPSGCSLRFHSTINNNNHIFSESDLNLKDAPAHTLFQKLGYTRHPSSGLVHWLPIGLRVLRNIEDIIHKRMREIDAEEVSLSSLSSKELWSSTNRWENAELFKLKDIKKADFCLAATCEEEITNIVKESLHSFKNLPLLYYQITRKYRDEKRPRAGLLRGREFLMKDAYSFDLNEQNAMHTYEKVVEAYYKIFQDLKIPFVKAEADSGDIGGSLSHEWHYEHELGEDSLFSCNNSSCGKVSNIEKTISYPKDGETGKDVVASVKYFLSESKDTLIVLYYPESRTLVPSFVKEYIPDIDLKNQNQEEVLAEFTKNEGDIITKRIVRVMDSRLSDRSILPDFPVPFHRGSFSTLMDIPLVEAMQGEICSECSDGELVATKSIEVGHTFYLGDKYSKPLDCSVVDINGERNPLSMGCYGIGVSRLVGAIAEMTKDNKGLRWPAAITPYHLTIIESPYNYEENVLKIDRLCHEWKTTDPDLKVQRDFRPLSKHSLSKKIKDSNALGIPLVVIIGKAFPKVEIEIRGQRFGKKSEKYLWEKLFECKGEEYGWEITEIKGIEKHVVHIGGLTDVIKSLLKDL